MRDRDVLGGDERQQFSRMVAAKKREQDIKVVSRALSAEHQPYNGTVVLFIEMLIVQPKATDLLTFLLTPTPPFFFPHKGSRAA
jgi:hypothetical protein